MQTSRAEPIDFPKLSDFLRASPIRTVFFFTLRSPDTGAPGDILE